MADVKKLPVETHEVCATSDPASEKEICATPVVNVKFIPVASDQVFRASVAKNCPSDCKEAIFTDIVPPVETFHCVGA